jgi:hypothetical protein
LLGAARVVGVRRRMIFVSGKFSRIVQRAG